MHTEIINSIFQFGNQYFNSNDVKKLYNQEVEFKFSIIENDEINAHIEPILDKMDNIIGYRIVFYTGLIQKLSGHAQYIIAQKYANTGLQKRNKFVTFLLFMWLHFIMFHEWGHAICGHLKYELTNLPNVKKWSEFDKLNESLKLINTYPNLYQVMELEADSQAAKFLLQPFSEIYHNYSIDLYGNLNNDMLWHDFVFSILSLFEFFESLNPQNCDDGIHPFPFIRVYACLMTVIGELSSRPQLLEHLPKINLDESQEPNSPKSLSDYFTKKMIEFNFSKNKLNLENQEDIEIFMKKQIFASDFCSKVDEVVRKAQLCEFRLTTTKF